MLISLHKPIEIVSTHAHSRKQQLKDYLTISTHTLVKSVTHTTSFNSCTMEANDEIARSYNFNSYATKRNYYMLYLLFNNIMIVLGANWHKWLCTLSVRT